MINITHGAVMAPNDNNGTLKKKTMTITAHVATPATKNVGIEAAATNAG